MNYDPTKSIWHEDFSPLARRTLDLLADQCTELEGRIGILADALRDIEDIAQDNLDLGRDDLNSILHICQTGGVKAAMSA